MENNQTVVINDRDIDFFGYYDYYLKVQKNLIIRGENVCGVYFRLNKAHYFVTEGGTFSGIFFDSETNIKYYVNDQREVYQHQNFIYTKVGEIINHKEFFDIMKVKIIACGLFPVVSEELLGFYVLAGVNKDILNGADYNYFNNIRNDRKYVVRGDGSFEDSKANTQYNLISGEFFKLMKARSATVYHEFKGEIQIRQDARLQKQKEEEEQRARLEEAQRLRQINQNRPSNTYQQIPQKTVHDNFFKETPPPVENKPLPGEQLKDKIFYDIRGFEYQRIDNEGTIRDRSGYWIGNVENDGTIRDIHGFRTGSIESDGTMRDIRGTRTGAIENDGTMRDIHGFRISDVKSEDKSTILDTFFYWLK